MDAGLTIVMERIEVGRLWIDGIRRTTMDVEAVREIVCQGSRRCDGLYFRSGDCLDRADCLVNPTDEQTGTSIAELMVALSRTERQAGG